MGSVGRAFSAHIFELQGTSPHKAVHTVRYRPAARDAERPVYVALAAVPAAVRVDGAI